MKISIDLQEPLHYMILWVIAAILAIAVIFAVQFFLRRILKKVLRDKPKKQPVPMERPGLARALIRRKYLGQIDSLHQTFYSGGCGVREAYQRMSLIIRNFAHEMTGVEVQNFTLAEIRLLNIPELTYLVKDYYEPEFSLESIGDVRKSLGRTRKAIAEWP
ncbi:MAG: hypothetical protein UHN88_08895 [Eubacterium sp.]|nr:hypothetical protein [Eubacterium sp.]